MNFTFDGIKYTVNPNKEYLCTLGIKSRGFTPLMYLVMKLNHIKDDSKLEEFIKKNIDQLNKPNDMGYTPLILACANNRDNNKENIIKVLISAECNLNSQNIGGETALMIAPLRNIGITNSLTMLRLLIDSGANLNLQDKTGKTALMRYCRQLTPDLIMMLIKSKNIDLNIQDKNGVTAPIHLLCSNYISNDEKINIMKLFLDKGIDVNIKDNHDNDLLNMICNLKIISTTGSILLGFNHLQNSMIKLLLDTNINLKNNTSITGFENICMHANEETIKYCFEKHKYYTGNDLIKCIKVTTKHKKLLISILENFFLEIGNELKAY